jgi:hypothetical protein
MSSSTSSSSLLLCVLVKSAKIQLSDSSFLLTNKNLYFSFYFLLDECCSYAVLKIDNVKSTTTVVKGLTPSWEQEFYL